MNEYTPRILIVDDEKSLRSYLEIILKREGYEIATASSGQEALDLMQQNSFDLVLTDIRMPGMSGIELLNRIKEIDSDPAVVIMTAYSTWETAVEAMRLGACDFIRKPFDNELIKNIVHRLIEYRCEHANSIAEQEAKIHLAEIVGNSAAMDDIFTTIHQASRTEATVLITGESGVGKELAARALHCSSLRREESFISINCSALVSTLLENEIFGHSKGAYTGADREKKGLLELAHKGTFFLDEIGDLDIALQGKILKVLEDREFYPVGSTTKRQVDVRFIAATNQDLEALISSGRFRQDLYYRINVIPVQLPPLRKRADDIPLLAGHFLKKYSASYAKNILNFSEKALTMLANHPWPGNVRELENAVQRAILACRSKIIDVQDISSLFSDRTPVQNDTLDISPGFDLTEKLIEVEKQYIEQALQLNDNNVTNAAKSLGMTFRAIRYKIKKYGINSK